MNYFFHLLIYFNLYVILALSLNLVVGYCGLLTLAHAAYFAIGAYTYALTTLKLGLGFLPALAMGMGIAMILSLAISLPAWRFRGDFFVILTLAVQALILSLCRNWFNSQANVGTWTNLTNGPFGISGVSKPAIFGIEFATIGSVAALSSFLAVFVAGLVWVLVRSPWGRVLKAIRDDELAVRNLGKNSRLAKVQAFAIACALAAVSGTIYCS